MTFKLLLSDKQRFFCFTVEGFAQTEMDYNTLDVKLLFESEITYNRNTKPSTIYLLSSILNLINAY